MQFTSILCSNLLKCPVTDRHAIRSIASATALMVSIGCSPSATRSDIATKAHRRSRPTLLTACATRRGLWHDDQPTPPWQWRAELKMERADVPTESDAA